MYTVDYFIKKFEAIPDFFWTTNSYGDSGIHCAYGHCGMSDLQFFSDHPEANALSEMVKNHFHVDILAEINDGIGGEYHQPTPKARVLAALCDIKAKQQPVYEDITASLAILPIEETADQPIKQLS